MNATRDLLRQLRDLGLLYTALSAHQTPTLPPLPIQAQVAEQGVVWEERLLGVCSLSDVKTVQASLQERLDKAEAAPGQLTPARQWGKRQIKEKGTLLAAIERIKLSERRVNTSFAATCAGDSLRS